MLPICPETPPKLVQIAQIFRAARGFFFADQRLPPDELRGNAIEIAWRPAIPSSKLTPEIEVGMSIRLGGTPN
jgi:hypothetical protein